MLNSILPQNVNRNFVPFGRDGLSFQYADQLDFRRLAGNSCDVTAQKTSRRPIIIRRLCFENISLFKEAIDVAGVDLISHDEKQVSSILAAPFNVVIP